MYGQGQGKPICCFDWIHLHDETGRQKKLGSGGCSIGRVASKMYIDSGAPAFTGRIFLILYPRYSDSRWVGVSIGKVCTCAFLPNELFVCAPAAPLQPGQIIGQFHCMLRSLNYAESTRDAIKIDGRHLRRRKENQKKGLQSKVSHIAPIPWSGHLCTHAHNHITRAGIR